MDLIESVTGRKWFETSSLRTMRIFNTRGRALYRGERAVGYGLSPIKWDSQTSSAPFEFQFPGKPQVSSTLNLCNDPDRFCVTCLFDRFRFYFVGRIIGKRLLGLWRRVDVRLKVVEKGDVDDEFASQYVFGVYPDSFFPRLDLTGTSKKKEQPEKISDPFSLPTMVSSFNEIQDSEDDSGTWTAPSGT